MTGEVQQIQDDGIKVTERLLKYTINELSLLLLAELKSILALLSI